MKKYVVIPLLVLPLVASAAPSVRKLGTAGSVVGTVAAGNVKAAPARAGSISKISGGKVASVGSLRARTSTTGLTGAITGSAARFGYANLPKTIWPGSGIRGINGGSGIVSAGVSNVTCDGANVCDRLNGLEGRVTVNEGNIENNTNSITNLSKSINSVRIGGSTKPNDFQGEFDDSEADHQRAWIWVDNNGLEL